MKKIKMILTVIVSFVSLNIVAQDMPADAAKEYNEGNKLLKAGNYDGAVKHYQEALKTSKDYRIYYQLGVTLRKQNKLTAAEDAFNESIKSNPNFDAAYNGLGGTYFQDGKYSEAIESFKKFEQLASKKQHKDQAKEYIARSYVRLGEAVKKEGNYNKAIEHFNEALKNHPLDAAYILLASTLYENGDYDKSIEASEQVLNLKSSNLKGAAHYYKGMALKQKQEISKAKESFELARRDAQYKRLAEYELNLLK